jgi:hypothetical protein
LTRRRWIVGRKVSVAGRAAASGRGPFVLVSVVSCTECRTRALPWADPTARERHCPAGGQHDRPPRSDTHRQVEAQRLRIAGHPRTSVARGSSCRDNSGDQMPELQRVPGRRRRPMPLTCRCCWLGRSAPLQGTGVVEGRAAPPWRVSRGSPDASYWLRELRLRRARAHPPSVRSALRVRLAGLAVVDEVWHQSVPARDLAPFAQHTAGACPGSSSTPSVIAGQPIRASAERCPRRVRTARGAPSGCGLEQSGPTV